MSVSPMRSRTIWRLLGIALAAGMGAVAGVAVSAAARPSAGHGARKPHLSARRILRIAERAASAAGDPRPSLIQHSEGTRRAANRVDSGEIVPGRQWSYLIAMRGHFVFRDASPPSGARMPTGSVLTLVVDASTGSVTDLGLSNRYPDLARLGPVHTDLRRQPSPGRAAQRTRAWVEPTTPAAR